MADSKFVYVAPTQTMPANLQLKRLPKKHVQCFCKRWSWHADPINKDYAILWGEYVSNRQGDDSVETVIKGKVDAICMSTARRHCPKLGRRELASTHSNDETWKLWFEEKRIITENAWRTKSGSAPPADTQQTMDTIR